MSSAVINPTIIGQMGPNPRATAIAERNAANQFQNSANQAMAGGKHKRLRGGATGIPVAQFSLPYKEQNGPGTGINSQTVDLNKTNTQGAAFAVDDSLASKRGGFRKRSSQRKRSRNSKVGGNPDWSWGCYSGGKRKTQRKHRKSRKNYRKSRKH
jgi:hypothetical protein